MGWNGGQKPEVEAGQDFGGMEAVEIHTKPWQEEKEWCRRSGVVMISDGRRRRD